MPAGVSKSGGGGHESGKARGRTRGRRGGEFSPEWLPPRHQRELLAVTSPSAEGSTLNPGPSRNLRSRIPISSRRQGLTQEFLNREDVRAAAGLGGLGGGGEGVAEVRPGTQEGGEEIAAVVRPGVQEGGEEIAAEVRPGTQQVEEEDEAMVQDIEGVRVALVEDRDVEEEFWLEDGDQGGMLPSAYVEIFRTVTRNAVNKSV